MTFRAKQFNVATGKLDNVKINPVTSRHCVMFPTIARLQMKFESGSFRTMGAFPTKKPPQFLADCGGLDRAFGYFYRFFHGSAISVSGIYDI